MMNIAVVGGKLQGVEVIYLARKAGFHTLLIDKNPQAPATGLCDRFLAFEFKKNGEIPVPPGRIDLIIPAIENEMVLLAVQAWALRTGIPLAFDPEAYTLSASKIKSNAYFQALNLPAPKPWPDCRFPVVVKPDQASGSEGVRIFETRTALCEQYPAPNKLKNKVVQEFIEGPSYSIEVLGRPGNYKAVQITELFMDDVNDCRRVTAPAGLSPELSDDLKGMVKTIARAIKLEGIMDLEVILNRGRLKILEIDARFPSQTPMAVFWSTGMNMVEMLARSFTGHQSSPVPEAQRPVMVEHIRVDGKKIAFCGEHIMSMEGPLWVTPGLFGADEAVTSYTPGKARWVATMIFTGRSADDIEAKRSACYKMISPEPG